MQAASYITWPTPVELATMSTRRLDPKASDPLVRRFYDAIETSRRTQLEMRLGIAKARQRLSEVRERAVHVKQLVSDGVDSTNRSE